MFSTIWVSIIILYVVHKIYILNTWKCFSVFWLTKKKKFCFFFWFDYFTQFRVLEIIVMYFGWYTDQSLKHRCSWIEIFSHVFHIYEKHIFQLYLSIFFNLCSEKYNSMQVLAQELLQTVFWIGSQYVY